MATNEKQNENNALDESDFTPTEFSIIELEDRLEFAQFCDDNCDCRPD